MGPKYNLNDFINACANIKSVGVRNEAQITARNQFKLDSKQSLLRFINERGMEDPYHYNTKLWEHNPDPSTPVMIDAYCFYSGTKYGYIAFRFNTKFNSWYIKSFKLNNDPDPRNMPFAKLGTLLTAKKKSEE
ncbi:MAG: hypothetical protein J7K96_03525 [Desulfobacteraceae bacterium]|nr:hypothetical protein [Desulfobacteraceae bacterium]